MKILIDLSYITSNNLHNGITVYIKRILDGLIQLEYTDNYSLLINQNTLPYLKNYAEKYEYYIVPTSHIFKNGILAKLLFLFRRVYTINKIKTSCLFIPYASPVAAFKTNKKTVLTVHDLIQFHDPKKYIYRIFFTKAINSGDTICISNFVKTDIIKTFKKKSEMNVFTIYNPVSLDTPEECSYIKSLKPFVLSINSITKSKNIVTLIKAFHLIKDIIPYKLVIIGKRTDYWIDEVEPLIYTLKLENRIIRINTILSNAEISYAYCNAELFVSPSLNEGFGYTPVEAAISGIPVITTKEASLPEVTKNRVNYYDPSTSAQALANLIKSLYDSPVSQKELSSISLDLTESYNPLLISRQINDLLLNIFTR